MIEVIFVDIPWSLRKLVPGEPYIPHLGFNSLFFAQKIDVLLLQIHVFLPKAFI